MKTASLLVTGLNRVEVGAIEIPAPQKGEVWVRVEWSGVSPGTELRCLRGEQAGQPGFPFVPGYNALGVVEQVGSEAEIAVAVRKSAAAAPKTE